MISFTAYSPGVKRYLLILLLFFVWIIHTGAETLLIDGTQSIFSLNRELQYMIDEDSSLSAREVYEQKDAFGIFPRESLPIPRNGTIWLFLEVENGSSKEHWIIENAMKIELMELHLKSSGFGDPLQRAGNKIAYTERNPKTRNPVFNLRIEPGESEEILIRLYDHQSASVRLKLIEEDTFQDLYNRETLLLGLVFGFFAALIVYNFLIFLFNRDRAYLLYSLYMVAFFLNQFAQERLFAQYLTPSQPYGFFWFILFGGLTAAFGLEFFRSFIETRSSMPRLDRLMGWLRNASFLLAFSAFVHAGPVSADLLNVLSLVAMAAILLALILRIIRRDLLALVCLAGSLLYLAGTAAEIFVTLVPVQVTPFILHAQLYGAITQVLFLGFALGAKTYRLRLQYNRIQQHYREDLERSVALRTDELEALNRKLAEHASTDALTGLYNRKELEQRAGELDPYLQRKEGAVHNYPVSVAYLDLDNFKYCNDTFGHGYGDQLLQDAASLLKENTRPYDLLFRVGGDEFLVIMPETDPAGARQIVERVRSSLEAAFRVEAKVSVSIGLASSVSFPGATLTELIEIADEALLQSKRAGKNRVSENQSVPAGR
jgi:two-component system, sensor histidine kinase LadS